MKITLVAAVAHNGVIGRNNELLWHLPDDFKHFKAVTMGKPIIMGRRTFESIGKPLPGRRNIVLSRNTVAIDGCEVFDSLDNAFAALATCEEVMIIGGANLYHQTMASADQLIITHVDATLEGDAVFPQIDPTQWRADVIATHPADARHQYGFKIVKYCAANNI